MKLFGFLRRRKEAELQKQRELEEQKKQEELQRKLKEAEELKIKQANCTHHWEHKREWVWVGSDGASDDYAWCEYYRCTKCGKRSRLHKVW